MWGTAVECQHFYARFEDTYLELTEKELNLHQNKSTNFDTHPQCRPMTSKTNVLWWLNKKKRKNYDLKIRIM